MAIHTAILFIALGTGSLLVHTDTTLMRLLTRAGRGGAVARRLLPAAIALPLILAWIPAYAERAGWLAPGPALALLASFTAAAFAALQWTHAAFLERTDQQHEQVQQELRASEARRRLIVDNAQDAVIIMDAAGIVREWNAQAEATFGFGRTEAVGQSLAQLIIPARSRDAHRSGLQRYLDTGVARVLNRHIELDALHRDQRKFPVELVITPLHIGNVTMFSACVRDITARRRAEAALGESRQLLQGIIESSHEAIISKTLDGTIISWNPAAEALFGYTAQEAIGQTLQMLIPPDRVAEEPAILARIGRGELVDHFETARLRADGTSIEISATISPLRDGDGRIIGASKLARDISERKAHERRVQAQVARLSLLQQITRAIGERQDMQSIFQVTVRSLEEHLPIDFGCIALYEPASQALKVACVGPKSQTLALELALPEQARISVDQNGLGRCLQGRLVYESDIAGSPFPFAAQLARGGLRALVIAPLSVDNEVFGAMIATRRVAASFASSDCEFLSQLSEHLALAAHQAQLHSSLQEAYEDLRRSQQTVLQQERLRVLGQMASGIAHDINNALSPAMLYAQWLLERKTPPLDVEARDNLMIIQRAIEDVAATVARMKDFYRRSEPGQSHATLDLNELIQHVIELTRFKWSAKPPASGLIVTLNKELAQNLPKVSGAKGEIRDAIANLVINAVDAMPQGGTLTLRSHTPDACHVCVEVVDTGLGMDEDTRQRCLEPFFTTKGERGTGLGLAMVYGMLERHDGEVQIESDPGKGTLVRMVFPGITDTRVDQSDVSRALRPIAALRILLVDDDPIVLNSLRELLAQDGHLVVAADGGRRGIDVFLAAEARGERFSVVITDLGMPQIDGRRVAAAVKAAAARMPVILLTGWGKGLQSESVPYVDRVLSKPPKLRELRRALSELTNQAS